MSRGPARPLRPPWPLVPVLLFGAGCAGGLDFGSPIADPHDLARRARAVSGTEEPTRIVFGWDYTGERGDLRGDGVARVNPPDRFRLDLFGAGEGSLQATLVDGRLATSGDLEGVELPPSVFLYAMTGIFRPGDAPPSGGFQNGDLRVLGYEAPEGRARYFYLTDDRLTRVEERRGSRRERWIELAWGADPAWPTSADYRDATTGSGVRWRLRSATVQPRPYEERFYVLPIPVEMEDDRRARRRLGVDGVLQLLRRRRAAQPPAHRVRRADREREHAVRDRKSVV